MRVLAFVAGFLGTGWLFASVVRSMLVLRSRRSRLAAQLERFFTRLARLALGALGDNRRQDNWLAAVAPGTLLAQLSLSAIAFVVTLGLLVYGTTDLSWSDSLYQSGSTFTRLGILEPVNIPSTIITFLAAFLGLVVIAVFIGYLMALYTMYSARESVMARWSISSGEPAWGPELPARAARRGREPASAPDSSALLDWLTTLRLNTQMVPVLGAFRSTTPHRHWVVSLLAMLDAVSLRVALSWSDTLADDVEFLTEGTIALALLDGHLATHNWHVEQRILDAGRGTPQTATPTLGDTEWDAGWAELTRAGRIERRDSATMRALFESIRSEYYPSALALAQRYHAVRAPWSGERAPATPVLEPILAGRETAE